MMSTADVHIQVLTSLDQFHELECVSGVTVHTKRGIPNIDMTNNKSIIVQKKSESSYKYNSHATSANKYVKNSHCTHY